MINVTQRADKTFPVLEITEDTLRALPPLYAEIAALLIEKGHWRLKDHQVIPDASRD